MGNEVFHRGVLTRVRAPNDPSSPNAECGATAAWRGARRRRKQRACALLDICSRTIVAHFPAVSVYRRIQKAVSSHPQTLGEHLRLARVDRNLTNVQVAQMLGVAYQTVERWEHNRNPISPKSKLKIVAFIGCDPEAVTDDSNR